MIEDTKQSHESQDSSQVIADEASRPPVAISVQNLSKTFIKPGHEVHTLKERALHPLRPRSQERRKVLEDVSFEIEQGEFFGIIGRNGSGKSTLLKCVADIYPIDSGQVSTSGRVSPFIELGVGFNPDLNALDNVCVNAALLGLTQKEARSRFDEIISYAELEEFVDLKFKNYSSGMQVRLGFASAIQADASILLVDEVLAVGDANFQEKCFNTFREMKQEGCTFLLVTHSMAAVEGFCDRALYLEDGKVAEIGKPSKVVAAYSKANLERQIHNDPLTGSQDQESTSGYSRDRSEPVEVVDVWVEDGKGARQTTLRYGTRATLGLQVRFHRSLEHPVVGITVRSEKQGNMPVFSLSTDTVGEPLPDVQQSQMVELSFSFDNLLTDGRYMVSVSVSESEGLPLIDSNAPRHSFGVYYCPHGQGQFLPPHAFDFRLGGPKVDAVE